MRAFTLIELVIVIVIIGILTTLAISHYGVYRERVIDNEARGNLDMIISAQRTFRIERNAFFISADEATLNTNLKLFLPIANMQWDYSTVQNVAGDTCCAQVTRTLAPVRNWRLCTNGQQPVLDINGCGVNAGNCP